MATTLAQPTQGNTHKRDHRWLILIVLAAAQLMVVLDATVVNIALPHAQADLHFSNAARQWVITAYSLAFGSLLLLGGRLADLLGRRRVFLVGVIGFAAASAVGGAALDFPMLVAARAVQGAFGALLAPAALSLLTTTFTEARERGKAFGIYGGIAAAGASVGLLLGGFLTQYLSWRWTMYVNVVMAFFAAGGGVALLPRLQLVAGRAVDRLGAALATAGFFGIVYGCAHAATKSGAAGWEDPQTVGSLVAGSALLVAFGLVERRREHALLPPRVLIDRNRAGSYVAMLLAAIGMFGVFLFVTYYLETIRGYTPVKTGAAFLPMTLLVMATSATVNTVLLRKVSPRLIVPFGLLLAALGMTLLSRITVSSGYLDTILPALLVVAVGLGCVFAPAFSLGTLGVARADAGVASATVNVSQQIGGAIGTALLNSVATSATATYIAGHAGQLPQRLLLAQGAIHGYVVGFWTAAAIFVAAAVVVAALLRSGLPDFAGNEQLAAATIGA